TLDIPAAIKRVLALAKPPTKAKKDAPAPGSVDAELEAFLAKLDRLVTFSKDVTKTSIHLVAGAEPVAEAQTRLLFNEPKERGFALREIVVNGIEGGDGCSACQGRRGLQAPHVRKFQGLDKSVPVSLVGRREISPKGLDGLKAFAKEVAGWKETKP